MRSRWPRTISLTTLILLLISQWLNTDAQNHRRRGRWAERERAGLAQAFKGITTHGRLDRNLFQIESTGVSTAPIVAAAEAFLEGLNDDQLLRVMFPVQSEEWRKWGNVHAYPRDGVSFEELNGPQRRLAFGLLGASLSAKGLQTTQDIMKLNETLAELTGRPDAFGRWKYFLTIMGDPSTESPWGWQLDGHHCIINYFVLGDQVVMSPVFMGSEPTQARSGTSRGTRVLQSEQETALELIRSLDAHQINQAIVSRRKTTNLNRLEMFRDNEVIPYRGIPANRLRPPQRAKLLALIKTFIGNLRPGHDAFKMKEIQHHLDQTYFAWVGHTTEDAVFYYRIHSPVVVIEFDHQQPVALGRRPSPPTRNHIHAVIRTPNGNDYGNALLKQHLKRYH